MNRTRHFAAVAAAAALGALTIPAFAQAGTGGPDAGAPVSRAEVRDDFRETREAGALTPDGDVGDTQRTLMARERYAEAKGQELRAEYERQAAVDAAAQAAPPPAPVAPFGAQDLQNPGSPAGAQPQ
ncbi:DUF4148 domain-containing protein [Rubrivivax gelatinosus]|uniref:Uncharacterized protein DUF4148 n=1 Tax=Rubrivivax gelatinosus TaxID=28068 RepID=A0A4R2MIW1_RUBGE|nr:DUF4148 domain-containing protein [Rubrivivax gelatinosus]MBK1690478.1 hypothetical protein [Rubrivivax gelatinosus]TCP04644.1 uncharacterized protein DUF4148 [Rubrivivax gelatinosus]